MKPHRFRSFQSPNLNSSSGEGPANQPYQQESLYQNPQDSFNSFLGSQGFEGNNMGVSNFRDSNAPSSRFGYPHTSNNYPPVGSLPNQLSRGDSSSGEARGNYVSAVYGTSHHQLGGGSAFIAPRGMSRSAQPEAGPDQRPFSRPRGDFGAHRGLANQDFQAGSPRFGSNPNYGGSSSKISHQFGFGSAPQRGDHSMGGLGMSYPGYRRPNESEAPQNSFPNSAFGGGDGGSGARGFNFPPSGFNSNYSSSKDAFGSNHAGSAAQGGGFGTFSRFPNSSSPRHNAPGALGSKERGGSGYKESANMGPQNSWEMGSSGNSSYGSNYGRSYGSGMGSPATDAAGNNWTSKGYGGFGSAFGGPNNSGSLGSNHQESSRGGPSYGAPELHSGGLGSNSFGNSLGGGGPRGAGGFGRSSSGSGAFRSGRFNPNSLRPDAQPRGVSATAYEQMGGTMMPGNPQIFEGSAAESRPSGGSSFRGAPLAGGASNSLGGTYWGANPSARGSGGSSARYPRW